MKREQKPKTIKVRSQVAVEAHFATGAGTHDGSKRRRNRRDRQNFKLDLRRGDYA